MQSKEHSAYDWLNSGLFRGFCQSCLGGQWVHRSSKWETVDTIGRRINHSKFLSIHIFPMLANRDVSNWRCLFSPQLKWPISEDKPPHFETYPNSQSHVNYLQILKRPNMVDVWQPFNAISAERILSMKWRITGFLWWITWFNGWTLFVLWVEADLCT